MTILIPNKDSFEYKKGYNEGIKKARQEELKFLDDWLKLHYCCDEADFEDESNCIECGRMEKRRIKLRQLLEKELK